MTKILDRQNQEDEQLKQLILKLLSEKEYLDSQSLIEDISIQTLFPKEKISHLIIQLQNEEKLQFRHSLFKRYFLSPNRVSFSLTIFLAVLTAIAVAFIPENAYPLTYVRIGLGLVFLLFLPGFAVIKMVFLPQNVKGKNIDAIERSVLSIVISVSLIPILGLILNYTVWGITLATLTLSLLGLTTIFSTVAYYRQNQLLKKLNI